MKLFWTHTVGCHCIELNNTPFSIGEKRHLHCQYGIHYFKSHQCISKRIKLQSTRKIGCTASVQIRKFVFYPEYSVDSQLSKSQTKKQERKIREITLKQLRNKLCSAHEASTVQTIDKYFISSGADLDF